MGPKSWDSEARIAVSTTEWVDFLDPRFWDEFEERQSSPADGVPSPLPTWNNVSGDDGGHIGPALGWFVVIGGNPGFGKTLLALLCGWEALKHGWRVGFLTFEMSEFQLAGRFFALATGERVRDLERGASYDRQTFARVKAELTRVMHDRQYASYVVNRKRPNGIDELLIAMRIMEEQQGVSVFLIDYLQLVAIGSEESIYKQVTEVTSALRDYAQRNAVLVIALSQFNRQTSSDYLQSPTIQGLHGGMIIEACADQIVLLDHSRYDTEKPHPHIAKSYAILGKNKHGHRAEIPIEWDYRRLQIREGLPDEVGGWPKHGDKRGGK